jgi:hypothetical protein
VFLHPGQHVLIGAAGQNNLAQHLGIQPGKGEESSIQRDPGSEDIGGIGLGKLPLRKEMDFSIKRGSRIYPPSAFRGDRNGTGFGTSMTALNDE